MLLEFLDPLLDGRGSLVSGLGMISGARVGRGGPVSRWGIATVVVLAGVVLYAIGRSNSKQPSTASYDRDAARRSALLREQDTIAAVSIKSMNWHQSYSVMTATFVFENKSEYDVRDVKVRCLHLGPSGTMIDSSERRIYEIVPAGGQKTVRSFNMGFIRNQATTTSCSIVTAQLGPHRPKPAIQISKAAPMNPATR